MALYAANNIRNAVENFADRSYAKVRGIILNRRNVADEEEKVRAFADSAGLDIVADIPRSDDIIRCEDAGKTVIEGAPDCAAAQRFFALAQKLAAEELSDE
jgi:nitrogenase iron protein NifH